MHVCGLKAAALSLLRPRAAAGGRRLWVLRACREPFAHVPERADAELTDESGPAARAPAQPGFHRQRANVTGLGCGVRIVVPLGAIIIEGRDFLLTHALGGEPARNMNVAEALHVREHLADAGPRRRAGGREGVADQNDPGLPIARGDV